MTLDAATLLVLLGGICPSACVVAVVLLGRRYVAQARDHAADAKTDADDAYASAANAQKAMDRAETVAAAVRLGEEPPTAEIPALTRGQAARADAASAHRGRHRVTPT